MRRHLDAAGISAVGGNFNEGLPEGPFDTAYLGSVSHMYGPEENLALIKRVADSLVPGGLIAIRDFIRGLSKGAALFAVNMLVNTESGDTYSEEEYISWLGTAGFERIEALPIPDRDTHLIVARRSGCSLPTNTLRSNPQAERRSWLLRSGTIVPGKLADNNIATTF